MASGDLEHFDFTALLESVDNITEIVEQHFETVARSLQRTLRTAAWLPEALKPPAPPVSGIVHIRYRPTDYLLMSIAWISRRRALSAAAFAFVGTSVFIIARKVRRQGRAKRRAKRAKNGARMEVVVLAGEPQSVLTRSIALDLERRGFIVYITVDTIPQEHMVKAYSRLDIRSLNLDITSSSKDDVIGKFDEFLKTTSFQVTGGTISTLHLTAFVQLPTFSPQTSAISDLPPAAWSDALTRHMLLPFSKIHAFLPLLTTHKSTILFLVSPYPVSFSSGLHALEGVIGGGLQQYISILREEIRSKGLNVAQMNLEHLDLHALNGENPHESKACQYSRVESTKRRLPGQSQMKAWRQLHNCIFDIVKRDMGAGQTTFLGRGSRTYDLLGRYAPSNITQWVSGRISKPSFNKHQRQHP